MNLMVSFQEGFFTCFSGADSGADSGAGTGGCGAVQAE